MQFEELKEKALLLPFSPGVYIMKNASGEVIYVGKAKKLKNRVTQYFQDVDAHTPKTKIMVSKIDDFDVIVAASEFEALVLECSLIKQHQPKYNILLKDDKGYPFIRVNFKEAYPDITIVNKVADDGASYFGPFGSRSTTQKLIKTIRNTMKLPDCGKKFPRDIGSSRHCLNYHMNLCEGWCQSDKSADEYDSVMQQVKCLLSGNYRRVTNDIQAQMQKYAEELQFELAANLRDRLRAVEALGKKQLVTAAISTDTDVVGFGQNETKACFTVMHFSEGNLIEKDYSVFAAPDDENIAVSSLLKQYYLNRGFAPKTILLPFAVEDGDIFAQLLELQYGRKVDLVTPKRGDKVKMVELACKNAQEEADRAADSSMRNNAVVGKLGAMLGISAPKRIEAFDISNLSGTDIVAGMTVFINGKASPGDYKRFKMDMMDDQDDYKAMAIAVERRFRRYVNGDPGFSVLPDLLLIDGGDKHATVAAEVLAMLGIEIPVLGMVKDDRHRTRALVTPDGKEISITVQQPVFSFIGRIQEATHNYAIGYHKKLRAKRLKYSELDKIPGIGEKRKQQLLKTYKSISAIRAAQLFELEMILPKNVAFSVYQHFKQQNEGSEGFCE